jgi:hypothetical protein
MRITLDPEPKKIDFYLNFYNVFTLLSQYSIYDNSLLKVDLNKLTHFRFNPICSSCRHNWISTATTTIGKQERKTLIVSFP